MDLADSTARAARSLARSPGLLLFAAVALAIGTAASTTMYSIAHGVLRDLPVPEGDRLVQIAALQPRLSREFVNLRTHDFLALRERQRTFTSVAALSFANHDVGAPAERPDRRFGAMVTVDAFRVLGVAPALGRDFAAEDAVPGGTPVVIIADDLWHTLFAADPSAVGGMLRVDGVPHTIIGVMPPRFNFPNNQQLWIPLRLEPFAAPAHSPWQYVAFGRLHAGVSLAAARADLADTAARLAAEHTATNEGVSLVARPYREFMLGPDIRRILRVMVMLVSCILLVAAANVANLLTARAVARSRVVAVRAALGATRARIIREHLLEAGVIAVLGGVLGLALARAGLALFTGAIAVILPYWADFELSLSVLLYATGCIIVATVAAGLVPALQVSGVDVQDALRDESRGASSFRIGRVTRGLVVAQIALSCTLLIVSGLMIKGVLIMTSTTGYEAQRVLVARYELRPQHYDQEQVARFHRNLVERLGVMPGVRATALTSHLPGVWTGVRAIEIDGVEYAAPADRPAVHAAVVTPGYFAATGAPPILSGRDFAWSDEADAPPVALANQAFARRFFDGDDPVGRRVRHFHAAAEPGPWITVVGLVANVGIRSEAGAAEDALYFPLGQHPARIMSVVLNAGGDPLTLLPALRTAIGDLDVDLPLYQAGRLDRVIMNARTLERVFGILFGCFGVAGLLLAAVGLYGVVSFALSRRQRELGIRAALGAGPANLLWLALRGVALQVGIGVLLGTALAAMVAPFFGDALFGISPRDPAVYLVVVATLALTAVTAALPPAWRAARVRPALVLQED